MSTNPADNGWPVLHHLDEIPAPPSLRVDALPGWLADFVRAEAVAAQVPIDFVANTAVGVLAATCQGLARVRVTEQWVEPLQLYVVSAMESGSNKSATYADLLRPLKAYEAELLAEYELRLPAILTEREMSEGDKRHLLGQLKKATGDKRAELQNELEVINQRLGELNTWPPQLILGDCTPEAVVEALCRQDGRIIWASSEGSEVFALSTGRYSQDKQSKLEPLLKAYDSEDITVNRIGRGNSHVPSPCLVVILTVQPYVLQKLQDGDPELEARGLLGRFLYVLPKSMVGLRSAHAPGVPRAIMEAYEARSRELIERERPSSAETPELTLTPEAEVIRVAHYDRTERAMAPGGELSHMKSWTSKSRGMLIRIAALLHLADGRTPTVPIEADHVASAVAIIDWYTEHTKAVWAMAGLDPNVANARKLWDFIERWAEPDEDGRLQVSRSVVYQKARGTFDREDFESAFTDLQDRGYVRRRCGEPANNRGPRPVIIEVRLGLIADENRP